MKFNQLFVLGLTMAAVSCGGSKGGGGNDQVAEKPSGDVNVANFKNTADSKTFSAKADQAEKIYDNTDTKLGKFKQSNSLNAMSASLLDSLPPMTGGDEGSGLELYDAEKCKANILTGNVNSFYSCEFTNGNKNIACHVVDATPKFCQVMEGGAEGGVDNNPEPNGGAKSPIDFENQIESIKLFSDGFTDCNSAFVGVKSLYEKGQKQLADSLLTLEKQQVSDINGAVAELKPLNDSNSALAFEYQSPTTMQGVTATGKIKGSANESVVLIEQQMKMTIDFERMGPMGPQGNDMLPGKKFAMDMNASIAADVKSQVIDFKNKLSLVFDQNVMSVDTITTIKGGDLPSIKQSFDFSQTSNGQTQAGKMNAEMTMTDANTLKIVGSVLGAQTAQFSYTVTKAADGTCKVSK